MGMIAIDMQMPKNCADCYFATANLVNGIIKLFCMTQAGRKMYAPDLISRKDRPEWCPLKEHEELVRCKDCKHRPIMPKDHTDGFDLEFPDNKCPCQCDDGWYSWYPEDNWFCANGERKDT